MFPIPNDDLGCQREPYIPLITSLEIPGILAASKLGENTGKAPSKVQGQTWGDVIPLFWEGRGVP